MKYQVRYKITEETTEDQKDMLMVYDCDTSERWHKVGYLEDTESEAMSTADYFRQNGIEATYDEVEEPDTVRPVITVTSADDLSPPVGEK
jgi:hypothetical protein